MQWILRILCAAAFVATVGMAQADAKAQAAKGLRTPTLADGEVGQRQTRKEAASTQKVMGRISNRIENRIRSRQDQDYDSTATITSSIEVASNKVRRKP